MSSDLKRHFIEAVILTYVGADIDQIAITTMGRSLLDEYSQGRAYDAQASLERLELKLMGELGIE